MIVRETLAARSTGRRGVPAEAPGARAYVMLALMRLPRIAMAASVMAAALALLAGCGAAPESVGPSGVDGLQIPTPTPEPADFVAEVSNPWLAWETGARWVYASTDAQGRAATYTVSVRPRRVRIAGIEATALRATSVTDGAGAEVVVETTYAAQDRDGNVWLLGRDDAAGSWRAGQQGAEAGLMMPATPRRGDGFVVSRVTGRDQERYRVLDVMATPPVAAEGTGTALLLGRSVVGEPSATTEEYFRRDVGLVARRHDGTDGVDVTLVERTEPSG